MFNHTLNIYQRPVQGQRFIRRFPMHGYSHKISAVGGYDTASFTLALNKSESENFALNYLGCRVAMYANNPHTPCWEGFINRVTISAGPYTYSRGLDEMVNRAKVVFNINGDSANTATSVVNNTDSQATYGIKEGSVEGYILEGSDSSRIEQLRNRILAEKAWPKPTTSYSAGGQFTIQVECLGFYHTIGWVGYDDNSGALSRTASASIIAVLATYPSPNTAFFSATDTTLISSNSSFSANRIRELTGQTYWQYLQSFQEAGDGLNAWIIGVSPVNKAGVRRVYYKQASNVLKYTYQRDKGVVKDRLGKPVFPWEVRPDGIARITDVFQGFNSGFPNDPRTLYVETVTYNADQRTVKLEGDDTLNPDGIFKLKKYFEIRGKTFGAKPRRQRG